MEVKIIKYLKDKIEKKIGIRISEIDKPTLFLFLITPVLIVLYNYNSIIENYEDIVNMSRIELKFFGIKILFFSLLILIILLFLYLRNRYSLFESISDGIGSVMMMFFSILLLSSFLYVIYKVSFNSFSLYPAITILSLISMVGLFMLLRIKLKFSFSAIFLIIMYLAIIEFFIIFIFYKN